MEAPGSQGSTPVPRTRAGLAILLMLAHAGLVMLTILIAAQALNEQDYLVSRCRYHNLDCSNPGRTVGAPVAIGVSLALVLLDIVLVVWRIRKGRWTFPIPSLFCVAQVAVIEALGFVADP